MSVAIPQITVPLRSHGVAVGHPQVRYPVQRRTPHQQLRRLSVKAARTDSLTEDHFHSKDLRLGQRTPMVLALSLPLSAPFVPDLSQVLIADVALGFPLPVLPDACPFARRDRRSRSSCPECVITVATVIGPVGTDLLDLLCALLQQVGEELRVLEVIGRDHHCHKLMCGWVHAQVEFAPRAAAHVSMLPHFPFAFSIDFDAGRVHDQVQWLGRGAARQLNLQRAPPPAQRRVVRHGQFQAQQCDHRTGQPFGGSERQTGHLFQSRHAEDGRVGVGARRTALSRTRVVMPCLKNIFADPQREASTLDESFVIFTPVTQTVRLLGFLLFHTKRIPAVPSP